MSENSYANRQKLYRWLYLILLVAIVAWYSLYPPWVGRMYHMGLEQPGKWSLHGAFGIDRQRAPLWNPPGPSGVGNQYSVRYPWQGVSDSNSVEINLGEVFIKISLAAVLLGLIFGGIHHFKRSSTPDLILQTAWALSLTLLITFLGLFVIVILSSGYGPPNSVSILLIGTAFCLGIAYGWMSYSRQGNPEKELPTEESDDVSSPPSKSFPGFGRSLLWFAVGIVSTFLITILSLFIASFFRGPVGGFTVLGTVRYVRDQTPINMATGLGILITGHALAFLSIRKFKLKSLGWGLIIGAILAGLAVAFAK